MTRPPDSLLHAPTTAGLDLASGFVGTWRPVWRSPLYQFGLILVAAAMLLLPLVYFGLIALAGWGVYWHVTTNHGMLQAAHGPRVLFLIGALYLLPGVAGLGLIVLMLKPLLAPPHPREDVFTIHRSEEPVLYRFVETVCEFIGAPPPRRIDIDCSVNAAASFNRGWGSLLRRGDMVLLVGTPLVAGMTLGQFAGVLAHEFGHFSQGVGMRASFVIHAINRWFVRMVYERDQWDWRIQQAMRESDRGFIWLVCLLIGLGAWAVRLVLKALLYFAVAISGFMARQMEYDADRHQARFCGSDTFAGACERLYALSWASEAAVNDVRDYWKVKQLPDDLPALIAHKAVHPPPEARDLITKHLGESKATWYDTHPSTPDRIRRAAKAQEPGVYRLDAPASALFRDFHSACKRASYGHYKGILGGSLNTATMVPTHGLLRAHACENSRRAGVAGYLGLEPPAWRPLFLPVSEIRPPEEPRRVYETLKASVAGMASAGRGAAAASEKFRKAEDTVLSCEKTRAVLDLGLPAVPRAFKLTHTTARAASDGASQGIADTADACAVLDPLLDAGGARLTSALRLLAAKGAGARVPDADSKRARAAVLVPVLAAMKRVFPEVLAVRNDLARAAVVGHALSMKNTHAKAKDAARKLSDSVRDRLDTVRREAGSVPYPYEQPEGEINLGQRLVPTTPGWRELEDIFSAGEDLVDRFPEDYRRVLGELVEIAVGVEKGLGIGAAKKAPATKRAVRDQGR